MTQPLREPFALGPMPAGRAMEVIDERLVHAPVRVVFDIARRVEHWPAYLAHYRHVRFRERTADGGGIVEMSAWRPFGLVGWPTWWLSEMSIDDAAPSIRFRHIDGITTGMEVEWTFTPVGDDTLVRIVHAWNGPHWPLIGVFAATSVIGPVFVHGIASRTLAGMASVAEESVKSEHRGSRLEARPFHPAVPSLESRTSTKESAPSADIDKESA
jgi:ribosome-associated toxin RatA of RatAB toxin-antitoxin module